MKRKHVLFSCGELKLEGVFYLPEMTNHHPGVILCHPHPLYGGDMNNNVLTRLAERLVSCGISGLAFNFRGVGQSEGSYSNGTGEVADAQAALDWLIAQPEIDKYRIGIAGYSFGASVALPVACIDNRIQGVALISPALYEQHLPQLKQCIKPKLLVSGNDDNIIPIQNIKRFYYEAAEPKELYVIDNADHFWCGVKEAKAMIQKSTAFFDKLLVKSDSL